MGYFILFFFTPKCLDYFFCQKKLGAEGGGMETWGLRRDEKTSKCLVNVLAVEKRKEKGSNVKLGI